MWFFFSFLSIFFFLFIYFIVLFFVGFFFNLCFLGPDINTQGSEWKEELTSGIKKNKKKTIYVEKKSKIIKKINVWNWKWTLRKQTKLSREGTLFHKDYESELRVLCTHWVLLNFRSNGSWRFPLVINLLLFSFTKCFTSVIKWHQV